MLKTKKELIKDYKEGLLNDLAVHNPSAFDAFILCEWNDEQAFGYYQYMLDEKQFFLVRMKPLNDDYYIRPFGKYLKTSQFMRMGK